MEQLGKNISDKFVKWTFSYFHPSLFQYLSKYQKLIFGDNPLQPHLAYLCPLCLKNYIAFFEDKLWVKGVFTMEHIPPESVGGKKLLLTCKDCNNSAGHAYEAELKSKMVYEASRNGHQDSYITANFETSSIDTSSKKIKGILTKNEQGINILDFHSKAKENDTRLKNWLENTSRQEGIEATLTIKRPDDKKILKTLLKSAYLFCFYHWGYDFIFSSNGELIRNVLNGKEEYARNSYSFWFDKNNLPKAGGLPPLGLCMIEKPEELKTFIVNFPLQYNEYLSMASIVIPFNGETGWNKLTEMNSLSFDQEYNITFTRLPIDLASGILDGYTERSKFFAQ